MLFEQRLRAGIEAGTVTLMVRRWARNKAIAGHRYRTGTGMIEVDTVEAVTEADLTDADAAQAGYADRAALIAELRGDPGTPLYRVRFHRVDEPDPRTRLAGNADLSEKDVIGIGARLTRFDAANPHGPWTAATLAAIAAHPGRRAAELAAELGWDDLPVFKRNVRKLKELGLTLSLEVGYRLSPRGAAYLGRSGRTP
ncbi:ASCH domain-containing protein [Amycolatopsis samaneae]|uniref:ASCH domain-containing protein n=1 Tax=Amycolatopsis samaneae TaxID=664691 RepID=A0ABW5GUM7_9PSEU